MQHCRCTSSSLNIFIKTLAGLDLRSLSTTNIPTLHALTRSITQRQHTHAITITSRRQYSSQVETIHNTHDAFDLAGLGSGTTTTAEPSQTKPAITKAHKRDDSTRTTRPRVDRPVNSTPGTRSRTDNRLARKVRRMKAGKWQPEGQKRLLAMDDGPAKAYEIARRGSYKRYKQSLVAEPTNGKAQSTGSKKKIAKARTTGLRAKPVQQRENAESTTEAMPVDETDETLDLTHEDEVLPTKREHVAKSEEQTSRIKQEGAVKQQDQNAEDREVREILRQVEQGESPKSWQPDFVRDAYARPPKDSKDWKPSKTKGARDDVKSVALERPERPTWQVQKAALKEKFGGAAWNPHKRLSPDSLNGIRTLHESDPDIYTTPVLAHHFNITAEAIRRILKSKWQPSAPEIEDRKQRWEKRGDNRRQNIRAQDTRRANARQINEIFNPVRDPEVYKY